MAMTITYKVKNGIYVNMTNRCPCACTFCLRQNAPGVYGSDPLWLDREPTVEEVEQSLSKWDLSSMDGGRLLRLRRACRAAEGFCWRSPPGSRKTTP